MPSKKFGQVPRPNFEVVGWDDSGIATPKDLVAAVPMRDIGKAAAKRDDMDDEIPF